jgi:hypothetical protein
MSSTNGCTEYQSQDQQFQENSARMRASSTKPKRGPRNSKRDEQKKFKRKRADQMKENTEIRRISNF